MNIDVELVAAGNLKVMIYNLKGELIKLLADESKSDGKYTYNWAGTNTSEETVASGVYIVIVEVDGSRQVKKAAVIK